MMLLLLACADPEPTPDLKTDLDTEDTAAPEPESSVDLPTPALSFEEVAEEIELALARGIPNPIEARAAYVQAIEAGGDNQCPGSGYTVITAFEGCTSQLGWLYAGYSEYSGPQNLSQRRDFHLLADVRFRDPQEQWYYSGGELAFQPDGDFAWSGSLQGTWSYPQGPLWMIGDGAGGILSLMVEGSPSDWQIAIDGSINAAGSYLHLRDVSLGNTVCDGELTGDIGWRSNDGYWYRAALDCGCGAMLFADEVDVGSGCLELTPYFSSLLEVGR